MTDTGAYPAARAAALSGVPQSTIHYWSRHDVLVPSVSAESVKLWSHSDLVGLRIIYWLRRPKGSPLTGDPREIPATTMPKVRRALRALNALAVPIWSAEEGSALVVDRGGNVYLRGPGGLQLPDGQRVDADVLNPIAEFESDEGVRGPHLLRPRPLLRIHPARLSGSPHVVGTRVETRAIGSLAESGMADAQIIALYPYLSPQAVEQAIDLERQLLGNLQRRAA